MVSSTKLPILCFLFTLLLSACAPPTRPFPNLATGADSGMMEMMDADPTVPPELIPITDNIYQCYCRAQVPLNCMSGCGTVGTNSHQTADGYCEFDTRMADICLPPRLNTNSIEYAEGQHQATLQDLEADCTGRVQANVREALRFGFPTCNSSSPLRTCDIRFGCSAVTTTGMIHSYHDDRCDNFCPFIALERSEANPNGNYNMATYVRDPQQIRCSGQMNVSTKRMCGWLH